MSVLACWSTNPNGAREQMLRRSMREYALLYPQAVCRRVARGSLGEGWTAALGGDWRSFDYIYLAADDVILHAGFQEAAIARLERGQVPAARMLGPWGELQRAGNAWGEESAPGAPARILQLPFLTPELLELCLPLPPITLYIDYWLTQRLQDAGVPIVYEPGCVFTHLIISSDESSRPDDARLFTEAGGRL